jgi:predicted CxxxxCH...CXXCH cytochrome family protein
MEIWNNAMSTQYFSTVSVPAGNNWSFSGGTSIPVTTSAASFRVVVTFKTHAALAPGTYAVTGNVTAFTTDDTAFTGSDTAGTTITVDNTPPSDATWGTITPGNNQIILNWTNPGADFTEVVILRKQDSAVGDAPTDGSTYSVPGTIGSSTIVYVGALQTFTDTGVTNGNNYYYKIFARDAYKNYSAGAGTGPHTPVAGPAGNPLIHNSTTATTGTVKWIGDGGWGIPGAKYGEFTCGTCHTPDTTNIKGVKGTISTPNTDTWPNGLQDVNVNFQSITTAPNTMGDDAGGHTSSTRVCEVCHSQTDFHRWDTTGQSDTSHYNNNDCTSACHKHDVGFKGAGSGCSCHSGTYTTPSAWWTTDTTHGVHFGLDAWYTDNYDDTNLSTSAYYRYNCRKCHEPAHSASPNPNITLSGTTPPPAGGTFNNVPETNNTCSNVYCHGNFWGGTTTNVPDWDTVATGNCGTCHGASAASPPVKASHSRHAGSGAGGLSLTCDYCHETTATSGYLIANAATHVSNAASWDLLRTNAKIGAGATYSGAEKNEKSPPSGTYGNCASIYCHSDVQNDGGTALGSSFETVQWGAAPVTCDSCHGTAATGDGKPNTGKHAKHLDNTIHGTYTCANCHNGKGDEQADHANYQINVSMNSVSEGGYSDPNGAPANNYTTCTSVYCHSTVQSASGGNPPASYKTPSWGGGVLACSGCHGNTEGTLTTGNHAKHLNTTTHATYTCAYCHNGYENGNTNSHANKVINLSMSSFGGGGYSDSAGAPANGFTTCTNIYCHSSVQTGAGGSPPTYTNRTWGDGALLCTGCHGNPPATPTANGAHATHTGSSGDFTYNYVCSDCHKGADAGNNTKHTDKTIDVDLTNNGASAAYNQAGTPGNGFSTCTSVYCHGSTTPAWDSTTITCSSCHSSMGAGTGGSAYMARHQRHTDTGTYKIACLNCHNVATHAKGLKDAVAPQQAAEVAYTLAAGAIQYNGGGTTFSYYDMDANPYTGAGVTPTAYSKGAAGGTDNTFPWTAGSCGQIWCHSNAAPWNGTNTYATPAWTGAGTSCTVCHQGASGGTTLSAKHEKHIVTYTQFTCDDCHVNTNATDSNTTLKAFPNSHLNSAKNVNFNTWVNSAATYDTGTHQCANTYCHSTGTSTSVGGTPTHAAYTWNAVPTCATCHGNPPAYADGSPKENSHVPHNAYTCDKCHYTTTTTGNTITTVANHVDKQYDIAQGTGVTITGYTPVTAPSTAGGTCTGISCHGGNNATWGATLNCSDCHTSATADTNDWVYDNGTVALIYTTEWTYSGHGKASGVYDVSTNQAANFPGAAGSLDPCLYCHRKNGVSHGDGTNPFRLANYDVPAGSGWRGNCLVCHDTDGTGYDPDANEGTSGYALKTATKKIDKWHYGANHAAARDGGLFCWDCHDPHGDSTTTGGPIEMIHLNPFKDTDGTYGVPTAVTGTAVIFSARSATGAGGFGDTSATGGWTGICNVCHTEKLADPNKMRYYTSANSLDSHNTAQLCTDCHKHSGNTTNDGKAFEGAGTCLGCHKVAQGARRAIVDGTAGNAGDDFIRPSRHVTNGTLTQIVTDFDCIVCHADGDTASTGTTIGTVGIHKDLSVDLRNVDNVANPGTAGTNYYVWDATPTTAKRDNMDRFCINCHDSDTSYSTASPWYVPESGDGRMVWARGAGAAAPMSNVYVARTDSFTATMDAAQIDEEKSTGVAAPAAAALQMVLRASPTNKDQMVAGYVTSGGVLEVLCYNAGTWTKDWTVSVGGTGTTRRFDIAYELTTGIPMVAYTPNAVDALNYRRKTGAACGAASWPAAGANIAPVRTAGTLAWIRLEGNPVAASNEMAVLWKDDANDLSAMKWSGSAWGAEPTAVLDATGSQVAAVGDVEGMDIAYESQSGDLMIAWGREANANFWYSTSASGTNTYSAAASAAAIQEVDHLDLSSNPSTNRILLAGATPTTVGVTLAVWDGTSAWTTNIALEVTAVTPTAGRKFVATGWLLNGATERGVIAYYDSAATNIGYITLNGTTFTAATDVSQDGRWGVQTQYDIQMDPINTDRLMLLVSDANSDVSAKRLVMSSAGTFQWTNSDDGAIETTTSTAIYKPWAFAYQRKVTGGNRGGGASTIAVNSTNDGLLTGTVAAPVARRYTPFNTNDNLLPYREYVSGTPPVPEGQLIDERLNRGRAQRSDETAINTDAKGHLVDVKGQFNYRNFAAATGKQWASHHNLNQFNKRYSTNQTGQLPAAAWEAYTTKEGVNLNTGASTTAGLHCSDCHLNEVNAHGARNSWYMASDRAGADAAGTATGLTTSTEHCVKCHSRLTYGEGAAGTSSRVNAHESGCGNIQGDTSYTGDVIAFIGSGGGGSAHIEQFPCLGCHGGRDFGEIHGMNKRYRVASGATDTTPTATIMKRYRFMSGAAMRYYSPTGTDTPADPAGWQGAAATNYGCYTVSSNTLGLPDTTWGSCNNHTALVTDSVNRVRNLEY